MTKKLTNDAIKKAQPGVVLKDATVPGLQLRAFPQRKSYYLYYRTKWGEERRPKLGDHGPLSLADARRIAKDWLARVAAGGDPAREYREHRAAPTVADLCDRFEKEHLPGLKPITRRDYKKWMDRFIRPRLGRTKVADVGRAHVTKLLEAVPGVTQPNRVLALFSSLMSYAEQLEWRPARSNPCATVKRRRERRRERYARGEELAKIARLLREYQPIRPEAVAFIYLLIYTGARPCEIGRASPEALQGSRVVLEEHKTDHTGAPRIINLPTQVVELLESLPKERKTLTGIRSPRALWEEIRAKAGCPDLRLYDLRHTFASYALAVLGDLDRVGELLGHTNKQTTARYAHLIDEMGQAWTQQTADEIERLMAARISG